MYSILVSTLLLGSIVSSTPFENVRRTDGHLGPVRNILLDGSNIESNPSGTDNVDRSAVATGVGSLGASASPPSVSSSDDVYDDGDNYDDDESDYGYPAAPAPIVPQGYDTYNVSGSNLGLQLKLAAPIKSDDLNKTISGLGNYLSLRASRGGQPLYTDEDPFVWAAALNDSSRVSIIATNVNTDPDYLLSWANLSVAVNQALVPYLAAHGNNRVANFYIVDRSLKNNSQIGFVQCSVANITHNFTAKASTTPNIVSMPWPAHNETKIQYDTTVASVKGDIDPSIMIDQLGDMLDWTNQYTTDADDDMFIGDPLFPSWSWTPQGPNNKSFSLNFPNVTQVPYADLVDLVSVVAHNLSHQGLYVGGQISVINPKNNAVLFNGTMSGSGPAQAPSSASSAAFSAAATPPAMSMTAPAQSSSAAASATAAPAPNLKVPALRSGGELICKQFDKKKDNSPNPCVEAAKIWTSNATYANHAYTNDTSYFVKPNNWAGKPNPGNIYCMTSIWPCGATTSTGQCAQGILGSQVGDIMNKILKQADICGGALGTLGAKDEISFSAGLTMIQNPQNLNDVNLPTAPVRTV